MIDQDKKSSLKTFEKRVFSGVQPTGGLTLGNYLGAVKRFVEMQNKEYKTIYCVVDQHAITAWQNPTELKQNTRQIAAFFIAAGIDPNSSILFNQSAVAEHAQLAWVFNCVARMGWMQRMTQFKDKAGKNAQNAALGLFAYPALMAADILLYHATHVPVGDDQKQHLELTRDIAIKFNHDYDIDFFPVTEPVIGGTASRVMSLRDGTKKMSKSETSDMSRINLTDNSDQIALKIRKAKTDQDPIPDAISGLETRPEAKNLINIYSSLEECKIQEVLDMFCGKPFSYFKPKLTELIINELKPISNQITKLLNHQDHIDKVLYNGSLQAKKISKPIIDKTYKILGLKNS